MASEPVLSRDVGKRTSRVVQPVIVISAAMVVSLLCERVTLLLERAQGIGMVNDAVVLLLLHPLQRRHGSRGFFRAREPLEFETPLYCRLKPFTCLEMLRSKGGMGARGMVGLKSDATRSQAACD